MNWLRMVRVVAVGALILFAGYESATRPALAASAGVLRVATYGGTLMEAQKSYLGEPFEALTGARIEWTPGTEEVFQNKLVAAGGKNPPYDVVLLDEPFYSIARTRGLLDQLEAARVPNLKHVQKEFRLPDDMGTCMFTFSSGIIYNKDQFQRHGIPAPTRWQDLASPKLGGRVGTQTLAATPPKYLLAAYAIQLGDPPTKWDRAIDEVAKVKFHSFSSAVADLMAKIEAGDVWAAPIVNGRAWTLIDKRLPVGFVLPDNGNGTKGGVSCTAISIPKGGPNRELAEKFISLALSPGAQFMQATNNPYGPVIDSLDPILQKAPQIADRIPWGSTAKSGFRLSWDEAGLRKFAEYVDAWNRKVQK